LTKDFKRSTFAVTNFRLTHLKTLGYLACLRFPCFRARVQRVTEKLVFFAKSRKRAKCVYFQVAWSANNFWRRFSLNPKQTKSQRKKKRTARVECRDRNSFWTTQAQFWAWVKTGVVRQTSEYPLTGLLVRESELKLVLRSHTVLNLSAPTHLAEVIKSRRLKK